MAVLLDCGAVVAMATAVEASDVAMRYVTEAEMCPPYTHTHTKILPLVTVSCFLGA